MKTLRNAFFLATTLVAVASAQGTPATVAHPMTPRPLVVANAPLTGELTEAVVKEFVSRQESRNATGVGSAPKSASVTFASVRFGAKRAADRRDRLVNGITGPTVHPARVNYTVLRTWGNGETESKTINYDYEFYKDEYGEWKAYMVGPAT